MTEIKSPTNLGWVIVRTICNDNKDIKNVRAIQKKMDSYTLTQYKNGTTEKKPQGTYHEENDFIPSQYVLNLSIEDYFNQANKLLAENPPSDDDSKMVKNMAKINVGANLEFESSIFGDDADSIFKEMVSNIQSKTMNDSKEFFKQNGCWSYMGKPIAEFGTEYSYRAFISLVGLGANPVSVAVYPKATTDSQGNRLNGSNDYVLHFDKDSLPTTEKYGFWSVTIYNSEDNFLIDNEIDRYCFNDKSDFIYNKDG